MRIPLGSDGAPLRSATTPNRLASRLIAMQNKFVETVQDHPPAGRRMFVHRTRVLLYARSASESQGSPDTRVEGQFRLLRKHAQDRGYSIIGEEADVGGSGDSPTRPGLISVMRRLRQRPRPFDVLLTRDRSGLARNTALSLEIARWLTAAGVRTEYLEGQAVDVSALMDDLHLQPIGFRRRWRDGLLPTGGKTS